MELESAVSLEEQRRIDGLRRIMMISEQPMDNTKSVIFPGYLPPSRFIAHAENIAFIVSQEMKIQFGDMHPRYVFYYYPKQPPVGQLMTKEEAEQHIATVPERHWYIGRAVFEAADVSGEVRSLPRKRDEAEPLIRFGLSNTASFALGAVSTAAMLHGGYLFGIFAAAAFVIYAGAAFRAILQQRPHGIEAIFRYKINHGDERLPEWRALAFEKTRVEIQRYLRQSHR